MPEIQFKAGRPPRNHLKLTRAKQVYQIIKTRGFASAVEISTLTGIDRANVYKYLTIKNGITRSVIDKRKWTWKW